MYKPLQIYAPQSRKAKNPPLNRPPSIAPGSLYLEIALKFKKKTKQNCTLTDKFLHFIPKNHYVCQMIAVKKCVTDTIFFITVCVVHS